MPRSIVRGVLNRYPRLRSTWPLQQASVWRQRQSWRTNPRRMASWYRETEDMHTRLFVSNLEVPEAPQLCQDVAVLVRVFDSAGAQLGEQRFAIPRNASSRKAGSLK